LFVLQNRDKDESDEGWTRASGIADKKLARERPRSGSGLLISHRSFSHSLPTSEKEEGIWVCCGQVDTGVKGIRERKSPSPQLDDPDDADIVYRCH